MGAPLKGKGEKPAWRGIVAGKGLGPRQACPRTGWDVWAPDFTRERFHNTFATAGPVGQRKGFG